MYFCISLSPAEGQSSKGFWPSWNRKGQDPPWSLFSSYPEGSHPSREAMCPAGCGNGDGKVYVRAVLHFYCWSFLLSTCEVVFDLGLSLGFVFILHLKGGKEIQEAPARWAWSRVALPPLSRRWCPIFCLTLLNGPVNPLQSQDCRGERPVARLQGLA